ncbi:hypothetical protein OG522_40370 (plasmid) [Streptomyces sp. NBC_01431]|nr:hypothetical protein [Streptomyces sp. NBC_01431]
MHNRCDLACDDCYVKVGISLDGDRAANDLHRRHLMTGTQHRAEMTVRFTIWEQITGVTGRPAAA